MRPVVALFILVALPIAAQGPAVDSSVSPCDDFYQYACGPWMAGHPIPAAESRWGRFEELEDRNREILRDILEKSRGQIGDYYAACMDVATINRKGIEALKPELERIAKLGDKMAITAEAARLHRMGVGALFDFSSGPDFKNSTVNIAQADQGGLGLPDRDFYLKTDPKSVELRGQYVAHVEKMFRLLGEPPARAKSNAQAVMQIEAGLARGSLDRTARREPARIYHQMTKAELISLNPDIAWPRYFEDIAAPEFDSLNVAVPAFFRRLEELIVLNSLDRWKAYLTWHLVHATAGLLPDAFVEENFNFYGRVLTGAQELRPRWKRCVSYTNRQLGFALGKAFVERTFGAEGKERTLRMVRAIERAMAQDIHKLTWMTPETKKQALMKLRAIANNIGYPDQWRDYSSVKIARDDALGNAARADRFEFQRQMDKIGKPVDRGEWFMTPPTVDAYYEGSLNTINFPAGILQPPFFGRSAGDATNFGAIGSVIGHEITHGFDDEGSQFDAQGNLRNWWTPRDHAAFQAREQCFVDQYSRFEPVPEVHLNGKLTLGENTADNGGLRLALMALRETARKPTQEKEQQLFVGFAQIWCENEREENARVRVTTDPHSPARARVNGVVQNMPEFGKAFACTAAQPMVTPRACRVW